jgi:hypothetical protein
LPGLNGKEGMMIDARYQILDKNFRRTTWNIAAVAVVELIIRACSGDNT